MSLISYNYIWKVIFSITFNILFDYYFITFSTTNLYFKLSFSEKAVGGLLLVTCYGDVLWDSGLTLKVKHLLITLCLSKKTCCTFPSLRKCVGERKSSIENSASENTLAVTFWQ